MQHKSFQQKLVLLTAILAIFIAIVFLWTRTEKKVEINCKENPTIGSLRAKVHLILFEDMNCYNCKVFSKTILPTLKKKYIDTDLVKFTVIPLAFMKNSAITANAALCVHQINSPKFYPYMQKLHSIELEEGKIKTGLIQLAFEEEKIDLLKLRQCMRQNHCYDLLDQNLQLAKKVMGKKFGTPALFINGMQIKALTLSNIFKQIEKELK